MKTKKKAKEKKSQVDKWEAIPYVCGDCKGEVWKLTLAYDKKDRRTYLMIVCGNDDCVESKRRELKGDLGSVPIWDQFDITGQGYDSPEMAPNCRLCGPDREVN